MSEDKPVSGSTFGRQIVNQVPGVECKVKDDNVLECIVPAEKIRNVVAMIDESVSDAFPESVFGVDLTKDKYELIYIFWSRTNRTLYQLRVALEGPNPAVDSVADIFPGLEWHERETWEMFGIDFQGHPDMRLLLLPDELEGKYPLRKSFETDRSRLSESGIPPPSPRPQRGGESE
ncbi:MAG: NADH-quinone oxidoreductase subunit C [Candidatus Thorarchaeota archaeon]|jgi:NADH-quinone oxidoreductase subunit C